MKAEAFNHVGFQSICCCPNLRAATPHFLQSIGLPHRQPQTKLEASL